MFAVFHFQQTQTAAIKTGAVAQISKSNGDDDGIQSRIFGGDSSDEDDGGLQSRIFRQARGIVAIIATVYRRALRIG